MNNNVERWLDRNAGVVLCFLLSMLEYVLRLTGLRRLQDGPPRKMMFVKPVEQGAIVLAHGAVKRAIDALGRENVFFFCFEKNREILDLMGMLPPENVITARDTHVLLLAWDMVRALRRMRRERIDTTIDLEIFARVSLIIAWLSGARRRVGLYRFNMEGAYRGSLITHRVQYNPFMHTAQAFDVFVQAAFCPAGEFPLLKAVPDEPDLHLPRFQPSPEDTQALKSLFSELGIPPAASGTFPVPLIVFNPKCLDELPVRRWPDGRFVELGARLLRHYPEACLLVTGLPSEQAACDALVAAMGSERACNLAGKQNLRGLVNLLSRSDLLVTSDSGPAHFAALTDCAILVLFGPETPLLYSPLSARMHILYRGLACSPCFSPMNYRLSPCTDNRCLQELTVDMAFDAAVEILDRRPPAPESMGG